ncbi:putative membrane protein [Nocardioides daedukensis]|uniref:Putative membrane protein n=1 Tax=Nocardioides daedukensis TaxID=634462 RepID=A0A7Y9UT28_9ACTN|nr:alpha/beta-hydrolase family protein [Nocardioides daedukensis]NYG57134.1 putative membrane protein [Nocardioides daedukensis]
MSPSALRRWSRAGLARPDIVGVLVAAWFFSQSLAPSLLLRSWLFQGVLTGVSTAVGYWLGTGLARMFRWVLAKTRWAQVRPPGQPAAWRLGAGVVAMLIVVWSVVKAAPEHEWTWQRLGHEASSFWFLYVGTAAVALLGAAVMFAVGALLRFLWSRLTGVGNWLLPRWIAGGLALVLLTWALLAALNNVVLQRTLDGFNATFAAGDRDLDGAPEQPESMFRSGGPRSSLDWASTGREGRRFLTRGPGTEELTDFTAGDVVEPVRVFVGRAEASSIAERVELAIQELETFGAFERAALLVVIPTGTGWINEQIVQPMEYLHNGNIATVAVQYSHLPSPLAFMAELDAAGDTGTRLVAEVEKRLAELDDPPHLYVAGESLGSFGGARAFDSLADSARRTAGALWVGPPASMHLRREAERIRRSGSTQVRPVVGDGEDFLFVNRTSDFDRVEADSRPHSVFLQQADDGVVWWDWDTAYSRPDWLEEPLDAEVNPDMRWTPLTTFLQLAVDMAVSNDFDEGQGHLYGTMPLTAWHAILAPAGWDEQKVERLRERLESVQR